MKIVNPPHPLFGKGGKDFSSLWKREAGEGFKRLISND